MTKKNVYEIITERFIDSLKEGKIPWRQSWKGTLPTNLVSGKKYNGINQLILMMSSSESYFVTYKQCKKLGGNIKKGSKGLPVTYWNFIEREVLKDGKKIKEEIPFLRYYTVFPISCTEGIEDKIPQGKENEEIESCEELVKRHNIKFGFGEPSYRPKSDVINMPPIGNFKSSAEYYGVLFHEMVHWTGHDSRLKRNLSGQVNDDYAKEELVAEIGAAFLRTIMGIDNDIIIENEKAYIQGWISKLENDPKLIICASTKSKKASEFILKVDK